MEDVFGKNSVFSYVVVFDRVFDWRRGSKNGKLDFSEKKKKRERRKKKKKNLKTGGEL